jgi:putative metalloenzyme radical SAM/SPASM domain maturase
MQIREGGKLSYLERAMAALVQARRALGNSRLLIGIEFVILPANLQELPAVLSWAAARGANFALVSHALPYNEAEAGNTTYKTCSADAIDLFMAWQARAAAEQFDLNLYPRIIWKFSKSPDERKIIGFIEEMKVEAERRGIFLDLKKLFALDLAKLERMAQIFREARQTAEACGIDLKLPELLLKEDRRCDFVEEGGMFVSWNGEVFPCYFLWHNYHCYASGWRQTVKPRSFGSLTGQNILDLWNSDEYRAFRNNVTGFNYPNCASCSLAPCDYVQTEKFEQDCHINAEPCGSCLWCTGIFQCLR